MVVIIVLGSRQCKASSPTRYVVPAENEHRDSDLLHRRQHDN